ncbi:MAG: FKBP-type peptidyl-prolyl cis-trans isomerase [Gammaproteobacteria bacterium]
MNKLITTACFILLAALLSGVGIAADNFKTAGKGVQYRDLIQGTGDHAEVGDVATIHFTSWLDDHGRQGREIYATRGQRAPVSFVIGTDRVMQGWNEGVIGMQAGGRRLVNVPAGPAFGARGVPNVVPPNTGMIFVIDLLALDKHPNKH